MKTYGPCPTCGESFESRYRKTYCKMQCYLKSDALLAKLKSHNDKLLSARVQSKCLQCDADLSFKKSLNRRFCKGTDCRRKYFANRFDRWIASPQGIALPQAYDEFLMLDKLPCLVAGCGWEGDQLANHMNFTHGVTAREFKRMAGFNLSTGLVSPDLRADLQQRDHIKNGNVHLLAARRDPREIGKETKGRPSLEAKEHQVKIRAIMNCEPGPERVCIGCSVVFRQRTPFGKVKFHSIQCRDAYYRLTARTITARCAECDVEFLASHQQTLRHERGFPVFHDIDCRQKHNGRIGAVTKQTAKDAAAV